MKRIAAAISLTLATLAATPAMAAAPVKDCAMRDAPFSADLPFLDILLSPAAKAVLVKASPEKFGNLPPFFSQTNPPSFAALLSLRAAAAMFGLPADLVANTDAELRKLPVTAADKLARCARYDNEQPKLTFAKGKTRVLIFDKVNGFYHQEAIPAARKAVTDMAERNGWSVQQTDKGGAINAKTLRNVDVLFWNNVSGDVLSLSQRAALKQYIERGGGFVGVHGSGGDPVYFWDWYADTLIGARFSGHPGEPQFQDARVVADDPKLALAYHILPEWRMKDEWYSFHTDPRLSGARVIATLDETTYDPKDRFGQNLRMGDHPIAWSKCVGKGRAFYSAIGHMPDSYTQPQNVAMLEAAITWAATDKKACQ